MTTLQQSRIAAAGCETRFDDLTRRLYATDASIYQIEPLGVALPRTAQDASAVIRVAAGENISVTPRGAGTSLVGNAIGEGLVVDFSRHNRQIADLNLEKGTVRVGAGVVLDQLNRFLKPYGFCFGPDVATSSRATLGGMIANNSSGAHVPIYGTTADHVVSIEIILADGRIENVGPESDALGAERSKINCLVQAAAFDIAQHRPPGLYKRWPGYGVERFLRASDNLGEILAGSEGTLAAIFSAELKLSPLPREKGLGLVFFGSVAEAMQATVALLDLQPAAIEHIDRPLFEQTKGQLHFQAARDLMELDTKPCESILIVEFFDDVAERLSNLEARNLGLRTKIFREAKEMELVWSVRKAGLSLLTGCIGSAKPVAFIEDAAVRPAQLPDYVRGLQAIMKPLCLRASYYGHAASGLLHVRPVLDLHLPSDLKKFRQVADETSALVRQFKGSLSAEHGVGIARTEYMPEQLGEQLLGLMGDIKCVFDPGNIFNPGKIFGPATARGDVAMAQQAVPGKIDSSLRDNFVRPIKLPFRPRLAFAFKDRSFIGNLEQCNGCGGCRKESGIMCPTFMATGEEIMSTRGRANIIRAALHSKDPLHSANLDLALSNCLSCKGCTPECPSNVNLALLKAEMLYARYRRDGFPLRERIFSSLDLLGRIGCMMPRLANEIIEFAPARKLLEIALGLSPRRSLPHYAGQRFDRWFVKRSSEAAFDKRQINDETVTEGGDHGSRGKVILWDDTFVRYHEPHIGIAAVKVLEALGFDVELARNRKCCGRPAFSQGNLDLAARVGKHNVDLLLSVQGASRSRTPNPPILFLEPSCWSMFVDDYRELKIDHAEKIAPHCFLFEKFVDDLLEREPNALLFANPAALNAPFSGTRDQGKNAAVTIAIHGHCHAKSLLDPSFMARLVERLPGRKAKLLETSCCGMAGSFGYLLDKYELSVEVAGDLIRKIDEARADVVIASGTSCRHQIRDLSNIRTRHMAEIIAEAIAFAGAAGRAAPSWSRS